MNAAIGLMALFSVLVPQKMWFAPTQPLNVTIKSGQPVSLVLTDFTGRAMEPSASTDVSDGATIDVKTIFPTTGTPGTYLLYAVPRGRGIDSFLGTPVVIGVRQDSRRGAPQGAMVTKVEPLRYAVMTTDAGAPLTMAFYYDVAPDTVNSFLTLSEQGYYEGLTFHRIVPGFVIQGGDPRGDGTGGPGYNLEAEFNDRPHDAGVLSMARSGDPNERYGESPRAEFANSAGSQFFICLDYANTKKLDHKYTAFGKVVSGMNTVQTIAAGKIADEETGRPEKPVVIKSVEVAAVTAAHNPYANLFAVPLTTEPSTAPPASAK
jgi:peptidyl-prolyl cis-trans isomerase B (cyclophilin B)